MVWSHLSINQPHLVYAFLGGFTSLFMLCSSVIKERLYIGEATVATLFGIIIGPYAANVINPIEWDGNLDQITLEFSRIILVCQCFAVGVELPKHYCERHWKSLTLLLVPTMTWGWLATSLIIWWMVPRLNWLDSLACAACVTATDPVLASSVVGKGKFAKRIPRHLRDLISAESGSNDGMAFPFVYFGIYMLRYRPDASKVSYYWICYTILYECIFGAVYGVVIGYAARRAIRLAHEKDLIDRESFLVFYFVLALFCAGTGSMLGLDDLLVGFACGVGFSNDGWFQEKTEESHVSNVIDLLLNLAFFVYFGTIIPWGELNSLAIGTTPWRLVVLAIFVLLFRRIPIMLILKPIIPDIKTWREALFAGHFGPIGVGALFVAIIVRAELQTGSTTPFDEMPEGDVPYRNVIELVWPLTTFLVICSIIVHGSSIAVFTLGKHINTLTLTLSYTQANEEGPSWMDRLPRIQSRSKTSMSLRRPDEADSSVDEKNEDTPPGTLLPIGIPGNFLRRQKEEESSSRASSVRPQNRRKKWDAGLGPGGPISQSAIAPQTRNQDQIEIFMPKCDNPEVHVHPDGSPASGSEIHSRRESSSQREVYKEGHHIVVENEDGDVVAMGDTSKESDGKNVDSIVEMSDVDIGATHSDGNKPQDATATGSATGHAKHFRNMAKRMGSFSGFGKHDEGSAPKAPKRPEMKRGPALAYQFGNTIIVEDDEGEVIQKYDMKSRPQADRKASEADPSSARERLRRMSTYLGVPVLPDPAAESSTAGQQPEGKKKGRKSRSEEEDDPRIRFTLASGGRRLSKAEFIQQIQRLDPKARARVVEQSDAPEAIKEAVKALEQTPAKRPESSGQTRKGSEAVSVADVEAEDVPFHSVTQDLEHYSFSGSETAAQRRRRLARQDTADVGREASPGTRGRQDSEMETAAERRRREGALGISREEESDTDDEGAGSKRAPAESQRSRPGIRFADQPAPRLKWDEDVGKHKKN